MNESERIAACLSGQEEEYRFIVDAYTSPLMALALNILGNREDAEDACQDAFVQAYRHLADYDPERPFRTWIFTITARRCFDLLRKRRRFRAFFDKAAHEPAQAKVAAPAEEGRGERLPAWDVLGRLTPRERTALTLWVVEESASAEIAAVLGCAPSTARVCLFNARRKIKAGLEERKDHEPLGAR